MNSGRFIDLPGTGPEDVFALSDGRLATGLSDGRVLAMAPDGTGMSELGHTGGRPLGLGQLPDGRLVICDAALGLLTMDIHTGDTEVLCAAGAHGVAFVNNCTVSRTGDIYFTCSSTRFGLERSQRDVIQRRPTGALYVLRAEGGLDRLQGDLAFANGVVLNGDETSLVFAETAEGRVKTLDLGTGQTSLLTDDLGGLPDNLTLGDDGLIWAAVIADWSKELRLVYRLPAWLRRGVSLLPIKPSGPVFPGRAVALDFDGTTRHRVDLPRGQADTTSILVRDGTLYAGSLSAGRILVQPAP